MILDKRKKYVMIIISVFVLLCTLYFCLIGDILVEIDELKKSDIIVVLMGSIPDRILEGVKLYNEDYGKKIVLVETYKEGYEILREENIEIPLGERVNELIAIEMGVPKEDIVIIKGGAQSTQDEAIELRDYLKEDLNISSFILVTSKSHSYRAKRIFEKALSGLDNEIEIISYPTRYDKFNPSRWWKNREDIEKVVFETIKLINFFLREQFQL